MKSLVVLILGFAFLCGCSRPALGARGDECWQHVLDILGKSHNEFEICRSGGIAFHQVYYPNSLLKLMPPTTCRSEGTATDGPNRITVYSFEPGTCENGRKLKQARFVCQHQAGAMVCRYEGFELAFNPLNLPPRQP